MSEPHRDLIRSEFERAAQGFDERTRGRFDVLDIVSFSRVGPNATVVEVGAGTGEFLQLFRGERRKLVAVDLTEGMLRRAAEKEMDLAILGDAGRLPLRSRSVDLVASAQMLHHVRQPVEVLREMRRVAREEGRVLVVDQVATERFEEIEMMNALEKLRDPSHVASRPPSAFDIMFRAAGLTIVDRSIFEDVQTMSRWMARGEFPDERFDSVEAFISEHGGATGMDFVKRDGEWSFTRRRIMLLAERAN